MKSIYFKHLILFLVLFSSNYLFSQNFKFGKVSKEELAEKEHPIEKDANAAILYSSRDLFYFYNDLEGILQEDRYHFRIKIYSKDGYDRAKKIITLYKKNAGTRQQIFDIKAFTYNLEGGEIVKSKLKKDGIFTEEVSDHFTKKTLTFPNVKVGSIIEVRYKIKSPFQGHISPVIVQETIPTNMLSQKIKIPGIFQFKLHYGGRHPFNIKQDTKNQTLGSQSMDSDIYIITEQDIPALKQEPYSGNIEDYRAKVDFEVSAFKQASGQFKTYAKTWESVCGEIARNTNFGKQLKKNNYFKEDLPLLIQDKKNDLEKAYSIYNHILSKIKWNEKNGKYTDQGTRHAYKKGVGNVADINLSLIAMLQAAKIQAHPVLISTRSNGKTMFPTLDGFNYVIAYFKDENGHEYLLDATDPLVGFGSLPDRALNWTGRLVTDLNDAIKITLPNNIISKQTKNISIKFDADGFIKGNVKTSFENRDAYFYRKKYYNFSEDKFIDKIEKANDAIEVGRCRVSNLKNVNKPISEIYQFESEEGVQTIGNELYFNSMLFWGDTKNIFTADNRQLPIDFITAWNETTIIQYTIPEGYTLKSKPEDFTYPLPNEIGYFSFKIVQTGSKITVYSLVEVQKHLIIADHYQDIKTMLDKIIEKHAEKMVLKKL